jgi:hypothetical protein
VYEPAVSNGARFEVVIPLRGYGDEQRPIDASCRGCRNQT